MMSTLSTISALVAALSLVNAAPTPQQSSSSGQQISIKVQLQGFDAASTVSATLDRTTVSTQPRIKEAEVNQQGPWCAGFSDAGATRVVRALNGDGIFDSANPAIYSNDNDRTVTVASYWCAATRREVENFVARAGGSGNGNNGGNNGNDDNNDNNNAAPTTVRVQIELEAGTTFVQAELPANAGLTSASTVRNLAGQEVVSVSVVGEGNCRFFANNSGSRAATFPGEVKSFQCSA